MDTSEWITLGTMAYIFTGTGLTSYNFSAPRYAQKLYILHRSPLHIALFVLFWPLWALHDARMEMMTTGCSFTRYYVGGVLLTAAGVFMWTLLVYKVSLFVIQYHPVNFVLTGLIAHFFLAPSMAGFNMPRHQN